MTEAKRFSEINVTKQREILEQRIQEAMDTGDPVIVLPFDTYPVVNAEMAEAGWFYKKWWEQPTRKECAMFIQKQYWEKMCHVHPKQYQYPDK